MNYNYILHCSLLYLDSRFTTMLRVREERTGSTRANTKLEAKDAEKVDELKWLHKHCIDYHMEFLSQDRFNDEKLEFMKESELVRTLLRREEEAARKIEREIEAARQATRLAVKKRARSKISTCI